MQRLPVKRFTNSCPFDFAVPAAEQREWTSFLSSKFVNTADSCASVAPCGEPGICGGSNGQTYVMRCGGIHIGGINTGMTEGCISGTLTGAGEYSPNGDLDQIYYWTCQGADGGTSASCEWDFHSCLAG